MSKIESRDGARALLEEFKAKQLAEVAKDEDQAKLMARLQG